MATTIRIPGIRERDVDLFLLEEFVASSDFQSWFLAAIGIEGSASLFDAGRSVNTLTGESDLELTFQGSTGAIKVLIENKVDAAFQPNQPQRYAERAAGYEAAGKYREVVTVLMAPEVYFGDEPEKHGFDARIAYEEVLNWFARPERASPRTDYKIALLRAAIERGRGWMAARATPKCRGLLAVVLATRRACRTSPVHARPKERDPGRIALHCVPAGKLARECEVETQGCVWACRP